LTDGRGGGQKKVDMVLREGKWKQVCIDGRGHKRYKREVVKEDALGKLEVQIITMPSTPSDRRWAKNALADLRRMDDGVFQTFVAGEHDEDDPDRDDRREITRRELHDLHEKLKEYTGQTRAIEEQIAIRTSTLEALWE
jgi:hypothetical protein